MIQKEDLLPGTKALYGIEFESIIVDIENANLICINNDRLYDNYHQLYKTTSIEKLMEELPDWEVPELFEYHTSGLNCHRYNDSDKRLEFASYALSPTNRKPSELFDTLEKMRDAFYDWAYEQYYLPNHGTITLLSDDKKVIYTTVTGGTHMTISFPLTIHDNPVTWKYFMWLFLGLVTMYQPIYIALNGAPSSKTKGSERQRTSGSLLVGSAYMYNIFTPESGRYEIFINSPSGNYNLREYPFYAHWYDKNLVYDKTPWLGHTKSDIGISSYTRSDSFKLIHNNSFILEDKEKILYKQFFTNNSDDTQLYDNFIGNLASMTSNIIEFRFFDNEPTKDLLNKFNLLVRMADYAYEQSKNMEESVGIKSLSDFLEHQIDTRLNIRPLVNTKAWHDAVLESMNEGLDSTFKEQFIDECYEFLNLTQFSTFLENPVMKQISAIDLNKAFVDEMNTAEHHFSEYFQTDNPTSDYSKQYQIQQLRTSKHTAEDKKLAHEEKVAREAEEERQTKLRLDKERNKKIIEIIDENLQTMNQTNPELLDSIVKYIDKSELANIIRYAIYERGHDAQDLMFNRETTIESSLKTPFEDSPKEIIEWFKNSLVLDLRQKEPKLKKREDAEDRRREQELERERQQQREREVIEQQINFIANIVTKNIEKITDEKLKDLILTTIHLKKISDTLRKSIYIDKDSMESLFFKSETIVKKSSLDEISFINLNVESLMLLYEWFRESLLLDLESNIPELRERSQPQTSSQTTMFHRTPQTEDERKSKIRSIIIETVDRLNDESQHAVITTISYNKLTDVLYSRLYVHQQSFSELEELSDLIIKDATPESTTRTINEDTIVKAWFKVGLLSTLRSYLTERSETRRYGDTIEHIHASHEYWHPETRIHPDQSNLPEGHVKTQTQPAHGDSVMLTLYAFSDYLEGMDELPEGFKLYRNIELAETQYFNEHPRSSNIKTFRINIATNDLSYHGNDMFVTIRPTSRVEIELERTSIYDVVRSNIDEISSESIKNIIKSNINKENLSTLLDELINVKNYTSSEILEKIDDIITHSSYSVIDEHTENYMIIKKWFIDDLMQHLMEVGLLKSEEPEPDFSDDQPEHIPLENDERKIYDSYVTSIRNVNDENAQRIINMYINPAELVHEIHTKIMNDSSTEQIKTSAAIITRNSIFDGASVPDNKKEIIDAWFVGFLIPQLIQDDILNPLQETSTETLNYPEEQRENETSIILDIIKLNIENLENPEMKNIVLKYILLNPLTNQLHELIYILKYNTLELRTNSLDLLIQEGFLDELNEDYVTDPEVISLLKIWLNDYLIPDLVKGTPLELGGLDVLFG